MTEAVDPGRSGLVAALAEAMDRFHVPGAAVGVLHQGVEWTDGLGVTSVDHPLAVTPDTLFQIGSITKTVTGTAIMRLVERGTIDLDAPLQAYLPDLRLADEDVAARVTMRHLLTHTGGWLGDYFDDTGRGDDALARIVERMVALPQISPLGEIMSYCNSGFYLAGRVIEVVTGLTYEDAARQLVLRPLGMDSSYFFPEEIMTCRYVSGHQVREGTAIVASPWAVARSCNPVGGVIAPAGDLLRYARFHMGDGTAQSGELLLQHASLAAMQSPQVPAFLPYDHVGITWRLRRIDGVLLVSHTGGTQGQCSSLVMAPERGFALVVLTNADNGDAMAEMVTAWALDRYLGARRPQPALLDLPEDRLAEYAGCYSSPLSDREISLRNGGLLLQIRPKGGFPDKKSPPSPAPPPVRLGVWGEDRVVGLDDPMKGTDGTFIRGRDGSVRALHMGSRLAPKVS